MEKSELEVNEVKFEKISDDIHYDTNLEEFSVEDKEKIQQDKQSGFQIHKVILEKISDKTRDYIAILTWKQPFVKVYFLKTSISEERIKQRWALEI
jgi:hypothetical protein